MPSRALLALLLLQPVLHSPCRLMLSLASPQPPSPSCQGLSAMAHELPAAEPAAASPKQWQQLLSALLWHRAGAVEPGGRSSSCAWQLLARAGLGVPQLCSVPAGLPLHGQELTWHCLLPSASVSHAALCSPLSPLGAEGSSTPKLLPLSPSGQLLLPCPSHPCPGVSPGCPGTGGWGQLVARGW